MVEENLGIGSMEQIESPNSGEKFTEKDIIHIQESEKQAKKVAQQIQNNKQINNKIAKFLAFLMKDIKEENLLKDVYQVFFTTKDEQKNITYLKKNINSILIAGMFAPFYPNQIQKFQLNIYFEKFRNFGQKVTVDTYIDYLKKLSKHYHDNVPINQQTLINFLINLFVYYKVLPPETKETEQHNHITHTIKTKLFG